MIEERLFRRVASFQLMDDNSRVLQQLEHYKDLAHTWASLSHEMFSTVKGTIDMVHPMDFLSSSGQKDDRDSAELLVCALMCWWLVWMGVCLGT